MSQCLQEIREQLEISNKDHIITVQKYEKDLKEVLNVHAEEKSKLKQLLENTKEEYLKELENVRYREYKNLLIQCIECIFLIIFNNCYILFYRL